MIAMATKKTLMITDVTCAFCGAACDDIVVEVDEAGKEILNVYNACECGAANFLGNHQAPRFTTPLWREDKSEEFKPISWDEALEKAADILLGAKVPILFGWTETSVETCREAILLTELVGGVSDGQVIHCHGPSIQAIQAVGYPSATLGDVKNRADVVVYWGCNPMNAHARHLARYTTYVRGFFRQNGKFERTLVVVDPRVSDTAKIADLHLQVNLGEDYELFQAMRAYLRGHELQGEKISGVPVEKIKQAVDLMKEANYGILHFGLGLTHSSSKSKNIEGGISLIRELNDHSKWQIMPLTGHYNVVGYVATMTWTTGYPFATSFHRGYPVYNVGEFSAPDLLRRGQADAMFVMGADPGAHLAAEAVAHMAKIPLIVSEIHPTPTTELANLVLPATHNGIEAEGSCYRMDSVPLHMRKVIDPPEGCMESDTVVLRKIREIVERKLMEGSD
ncbi:MAG: formylmethanofuran dehydrogenase subunit B [Promethearchaeota archaeon]